MTTINKDNPRGLGDASPQPKPCILYTHAGNILVIINCMKYRNVYNVCLKMRDFILKIEKCRPPNNEEGTPLLKLLPLM